MGSSLIICQNCGNKYQKTGILYCYGCGATMIENQDKIKLANAVKSSLYDIQKVESTSNFKYSRISKKKEKYDYKTIVFILFLIILIIIAGRSSILIFGGLVIFLAIYIISLLRHELQL